MGKLVIGMLSLLICALSSLVRAQSASDWKEYSSAEGKFRILMPGEPSKKMRCKGDDSPHSVTYVAKFEDDKQTWTVAYFDAPVRPASAEAIKKIFDRTCDYRTRSAYHKIIDEKDQDFSGYPARDIKIRFDYDSERVELTKIVLVGQRVYEISVVTFVNSADAPDVHRYFDSFRAEPLTDEEIKTLKSFSEAENEKAIPRKIQVTRGVLEVTAIRKVKPNYPPRAEAAGISGKVEVRVLVSEQGEVIEAQATSGPEELRDISVQAARNWRFKPSYYCDAIVKVEGPLLFNFTLR
jgi:TonB family protein